ncbi:hypothetical protein [Methylorubrum extorquens]
MADDAGFGALVSSAADYLSIISAFLSGLTLVGIGRVKKELTTRSLLPNIVETLTDINSNISGCLSNFTQNAEDFSNEIAKCKASLRPLSKIKNDAGKDARRILSLIEGYGKQKAWYDFSKSDSTAGVDDNKRKARKIYEEINGLIEEVKRLMIEQRLGS